MKPYAWINVNDEYKILFDDELPTLYPEAWMPLYSHPVKELTDEEIRALWNPMPDTKVYVRDLLSFARTVLKKASK